MNQPNNMPNQQHLTTPLPTPVPDSYWVVPGRLLAGEYPGAKAEAEARPKLRRFLDAGVTFFLDLTEAGELAPYASLLREEAASRNVAVEHHRMAISDLRNPGRPRLYGSSTPSMPPSPRATASTCTAGEGSAAPARPSAVTWCGKA